MRLVRYGERGEEKPAMLDPAGQLRDLSSLLDDITPSAIGNAVLQSLTHVDPDTLTVVCDEPRLGPPVAQTGKLVCIGLNYRDHAAETGMVVPEEPVLFTKATTAIIGPNDTVILPLGFTKADWEVELGVIIGKTARSVSEESASDYVAGYCVANDVSERAFQLEHGGQWVKGKSFDTFAPIGPWFVTKDEIADPHSLNIWLEVNGQRYQNGNTRTMIFSVPEIVSYVSRFMTLLPGDVIITGTPPGVGMGQSPPVYLKPGDRMRLGIDGLGVQEQLVVAPSDADHSVT